MESIIEKSYVRELQLYIIQNKDVATIFLSQEGMNTVLTLKDRGILEEGDDDEEVLVNVNMLDDERVQL